MYFSVAGIIPHLEHKHDWAEAFHVAFLFHLKANLQSVNSIDALCKASCYVDAFSVIRAMHSRVNLLILSTLNPHLFDEWLKNPKDPKFLDGKIREILESNSINTMGHMYEHYSEIIHGNFLALAEVGYMTKGVFSEVLAIMNQVYVSAKYLLSIAGYSIVAMTNIDLGKAGLPDSILKAKTIYEYFDKELLAANRLEHLQTVLAEDRHLHKIGKNKYIAGSAFSLQQLEYQVKKFHRQNQRKKLRKPYNTEKRKI